jgi:hypothetical protein
MSQPKRPYEQIPYPTGSDPAPPQPAAEVPAQPLPSPLPREWPDVPWSPDRPSAVAWSPDRPSGAAPEPPPADRPATTTRNTWKWLAVGLAILLSILVAAIVGRVTAPSQTSTAQTAPTQPPAAAPGLPYGQGPLFTPEPMPGGSTFTPQPGSPPTFYSGRGNAVVPITKDPGPAIVQFECDKCTGNTVLKSDGPESVLVNAIGAYSGRRPIDLQEGSNTTTITVGASESWRMTVSSGLVAARASVEGAPLTGQGDDVVIMNGNATTAHVTNSGLSGFVVYVVPVQSATVNLAVRTTGAYDGTISLTSPAIVIVESTGTWTIAPS